MTAASVPLWAVSWPVRAVRSICMVHLQNKLSKYQALSETYPRSTVCILGVLAQLSICVGSGERILWLCVRLVLTHRWPLIGCLKHFLEKFLIALQYRMCAAQGHLVCSGAPSSTGFLLFEICSPTILLISKELKHRENLPWIY